MSKLSTNSILLIGVVVGLTWFFVSMHCFGLFSTNNSKIEFATDWYKWLISIFGISFIGFSLGLAFDGWRAGMKNAILITGVIFGVYLIRWLTKLLL